MNGKLITIAERDIELLDSIKDETEYNTLKSDIADAFSIVQGLREITSEEQETMFLCLKKLNMLAKMLVVAREVDE